MENDKKHTVLIDFPKKDGWCHLVCDSIPYLHEFAEQIGVNRCWYSNKKNKFTGKSKNQPHYDVRGPQIQAAIDNGAVQVDSRILKTFVNKHFKSSDVKKGL